jgi:hypothetical protein
MFDCYAQMKGASAGRVEELRVAVEDHNWFVDRRRTPRTSQTET